MEQRVLFFKGLQKQFFDKVKYNLMVSSLRSILQFGLDTPYSTLKKYYNESFLLPRSLFEDLCRIAKINPQSLNVKYVESNWGQIIGGKKGIKVVQEKYPEEIKIWRKKAMLNSPVIGKGLNLKKVKLPELNENLAEFIGAYLGDGTITPYQIRIAGDYRYDIPYYRYLSKIIFDLFGIYPSFQKDKRDNNVALLVISSKTICSYLKDKFNIQYGDKIRNQNCIPSRIMNDERLVLACLRGLLDTDGSVSRRGRKGSQFCIQFTNYNKTLLKQVIAIGQKFGLFTFSDNTGAGTNRWDNIEKYFRLVGSSNLKHIVRFCLRKFENKTIYRNEVSDYFEEDLYKSLNLPFKLGAHSSMA